MYPRRRIAASLLAGLSASFVLLHWSYSTLTAMCVTREDHDWYRYSFLWLFEHFWPLIGIDINSNILLVSGLTVFAVHALVPLCGAVVFAGAAGAGVRTSGGSAIVALLWALLLFILLRLGVPLSFPDRPFLTEIIFALVGFSLCIRLANLTQSGRPSTHPKNTKGAGVLTNPGAPLTAYPKT